MKLSEGTPKQQAQMRTFRAYARKKYTQEFPCCVQFAAEVELLEALLRKHWSRPDAAALMAFLIDSSWDFVDPYGFINEWTIKAEMAMKQGMRFEEIEASGLLSSEGSLVPIDNLTPAQKRQHELMGFDEQASRPVKFRDRIRAMQKKGEWGTRSDN